MEDKLSKLLKYIEFKGFDIIIDKEGELFYYIKEENDTRKIIQTFVRKLETEITIGGSASAYIEIEKVEEILLAITGKVTYLKNTISASIGIDKDNSLSNNYFHIKNEKDLDTYLEQLDAYYQSHIAPFFAAVPTLQSFNDRVLSVVPFEEYHHYLSGKFGLKAMIIMHLCKSPLYDKYVSYREADFKESPDLYNLESRWHKMVKNSYDEFNKFKEMVEAGNV